jgi:hypothetical protein
MTTQFSDECWQILADATRREVDRMTNLRNLLNVTDLAEKAMECDGKALRAKRAELRHTFMDLAERYRVLAAKVQASQKDVCLFRQAGLFQRLLIGPDLPAAIESGCISPMAAP